MRGSVDVLPGRVSVADWKMMLEVEKVIAGFEPMK